MINFKQKEVIMAGFLQKQIPLTLEQIKASDRLLRMSDEEAAALPLLELPEQSSRCSFPFSSAILDAMKRAVAGPLHATLPESICPKHYSGKSPWLIPKPT